jgi:hypothetical protein
MRTECRAQAELDNLDGATPEYASAVRGDPIMAKAV